MKTINLFLILFLSAVILMLSSCKKDEEEIPGPQITLTELGLNNTKIGYIGSDLHIEAEIVAEGKIQTVKVEIHSACCTTWEFDSVFTEFAGLKNAEFHKHVDIPLIAEAGIYHFHLEVTDQNGNHAHLESELEIMVPTDSISPQILISSAPASGQTFAVGDTIRISGQITDNLSLGGVYIGLVRNDQNLTDPEVNADNTITLLHTHTFPNPVSFDFMASIRVGAALDNDITPDPITWTPGNYYILVKTKDAMGSNWTFSSHYAIIIN